jgi:hypothetical protein
MYGRCVFTAPAFETHCDTEPVRGNGAAGMLAALGAARAAKIMMRFWQFFASCSQACCRLMAATTIGVAQLVWQQIGQLRCALYLEQPGLQGFLGGCSRQIQLRLHCDTWSHRSLYRSIKEMAQQGCWLQLEQLGPDSCEVAAAVQCSVQHNLLR